MTMSHATHDPLESQASTVDLTETERHRLLEVDRRRHTLAVLADRSEPIDLEGLAAAVAATEDGVDDDDPDDVATVATTLHHIHLPKIADAGVASYDPAAKTIVP